MKKLLCPHCSFITFNAKGMSVHRSRKGHWGSPAPIPPPPPKILGVRSYRLLNGYNLKVGDKIRTTKESVITEITFKRNSDTAEVKVDILSDSWSKQI